MGRKLITFSYVEPMSSTLYYSPQTKNRIPSNASASRDRIAQRKGKEMQTTTPLPPILQRILAALETGDKRSTDLARIVYGSNSERLIHANRLNLRKSIDRLRRCGYAITCRRKNGNGIGTYCLVGQMTDCEHGEPNDGHCSECKRILREEEQHSRMKEERLGYY